MFDKRLYWLESRLSRHRTVPLAVGSTIPSSIAMPQPTMRYRAPDDRSTVFYAAPGQAAGGSSRTPRVASPTEPLPQRSYAFQDTMPREVLENYLSRAVQMESMCTDYPGFAPSTNLPSPTLAELNAILKAEADFLVDVGAKFIGRVAGWWGQWYADRELERLLTTADYLHTRDPEFILQACVFEVMFTSVHDHPAGTGMLIPQWAFDEFYPGQPYRSVFRVRVEADHTQGMLFDDSYPTSPTAPGHQLDQNGYFLDISRTETQLWVYWRAVRYLDAGCEAIHFGQVDITGDVVANPHNRHWWNVLTRIRDYAAGRKGVYYDNVLCRPLRQWAGRGARRGVVLCDGHTSGHLIYQPSAAREVQLVFDFHSSPLRPYSYTVSGAVFSAPQAEIRADFYHAIYRRSRGGYAPLPPHEFYASAPFLAEFDNVGRAGSPAVVANEGLPWVRTFDEITWFGGHQAAQGTSFVAGNAFWILDYTNGSIPNVGELLPDAATRNSYLRYFWHQVRRLDDNGWFNVPGRRGVYLATSAQTQLGQTQHTYPYGIGYLYRAYNEPTFPAGVRALPGGYGGQQATIKALFAGEVAHWEYDPLQADPALPGQARSWANVAGDVFDTHAGKVFYRSTDARVWTFFRAFEPATGWEWRQVSLDPGGVPRSDVAGPLAFDPARNRVYYRNTAGGLGLLQATDSQGWLHQDMGSLPGPADAPADHLLPDSQGRLFYRTRSGRVVAAYQDAAGTWRHSVLDPQAPLAAGDLVLAASGRIFYRGYEGQLHGLLYLP